MQCHAVPVQVLLRYGGHGRGHGHREMLGVPDATGDEEPKLPGRANRTVTPKATAAGRAPPGGALFAGAGTAHVVGGTQMLGALSTRGFSMMSRKDVQGEDGLGPGQDFPADFGVGDAGALACTHAVRQDS